MSEVIDNPVTTPVTTAETDVDNVTTAYTPVTTVKDDVTTDTDVKIEDFVVDIEDLVATPKKKPGRPAGSKSKEPGKPRAPRAKKVIEQEAEVETELPRPLANSIPIPAQSKDQQVSMMLTLLAGQARERQSKKVGLWQSWFVK
jgi:hypothetical protein